MENNNIILTADADLKDGYIDIYIGALLSEDTFREENMLPVGSVNGQEMDYSESEVFLRDDGGSQYFHKFHDVGDPLNPAIWDSVGNEEAAFKTITGPWEIPVNLNQNS